MKSRSGACTEPSATRHQAPWALPWGSRGPIRRGHDTIGARAQLQGWAPGPWARRSPPTACGVGWAAHTAAASRAAVHPLAASTAQGRQMADVRQLQPLMLLCAEGHQIVHSLPTLLLSAACSLVNEEYKLWKKNSPFLVSAAAGGSDSSSGLAGVDHAAAAFVPWQARLWTQHCICCPALIASRPPVPQCLQYGEAHLGRSRALSRWRSRGVPAAR